jgi:nucleotide-binding universal stress UspA family protein
MRGVSTTIVASDGSALALQSAAAGLAILQPTDKVIVITVVDGTYPSLTEDDLGNEARSAKNSANLRDERMAEGQRVLDQTAAAMNRNIETRLVEGSPGIAICELAKEMSADAVVIGSHGHSGVRRALLGSVADYVVRHAPCPVVVSGPGTTRTTS